MKCPTCENVILVITERKGIEIDYCPQCRGIWLDRGELDKLINKSDEHENTNPNRESFKRYDDDNYNKHKKKKGLLGDLFDF